jgi:hypothetical protein
MSSGSSSATTASNNTNKSDAKANPTDPEVNGFYFSLIFFF